MASEFTELFPPPPSFPPSTLSPTIWPGVSSESTEALQDVLTDNHKRYHIFFNDRNYHNHTTHHSIALWALGAPKALLQAAYKVDALMQKPAFESPEPVTADNFNEHLGDGKYFNAYMAFFKDSVVQKGTAAVLEEYIFAPKFNHIPSLPSGKNQPQMLDRFLSSILHPLIHMGYGAEFSLLGMVIEALAMTAVHEADHKSIIPADLFGSGTVPLLEQVTSQLRSTLLGPKATAKPPGKGTHAFTIMARILEDPMFSELDEPKDTVLFKFDQVLKSLGAPLLKHVNEWTLDTSDPKEVERKIEELQWVNAIIYTIPGWKKDKPFNADFFTMHLVTSSLFLPSLVAYLSPKSQAILLRSYFTVSLAWWIARGRPGFDIRGFFADDTAYPLPSGTLPTPPKWALPSPSSSISTTPNPWFHLIQRTVIDPDDHLCKLVRALAHYGRIYGARSAGLPDFSGTELAGAEKLDGRVKMDMNGDEKVISRENESIKNALAKECEVKTLLTL